ncbi:MAG: metallophosphoesterase [Enterococcus sp.]
MFILLLGLSVPLSIIFYAFFIEPRRLRERRYLIRKEKQKVLDISKAYDMYQLQTDLVIAHLSDFHFSYWFKPKRINRLIRSLRETQPDMILFSGDLIDDYQRWPSSQTELLIEKLKRLQAPKGKIAILGNHDYKHDGKHFIVEVLKEAGFTLLVNETNYQADQKISISIAGVDDALGGHPKYLYNLPTSDWRIMLIHQPDRIDQVPDLAKYDLVLAGHSHGGQIRLPFYRKVVQGARRYTHGLYWPSEKTLLSVNTGIGTTGIHARLAVLPEIIYYHLSTSEIAFETDFDGTKKKGIFKTTKEPEADDILFTHNHPTPVAAFPNQSPKISFHKELIKKTIFRKP